MTGGRRKARLGWVAAGFAAAAVVVRLVGLSMASKAPGGAVALWVGLALGVVVTGVTVGIVVVLYRRGGARAAQAAGPGAWTCRCVDPDRPDAWLTLAVTGTGVEILHRGRVDQRWAAPDLASVTVASVQQLGAVAHTGLVVTLRDGTTHRLLLPSRNLLSYPLGLAQDAAARIQRLIDATPPTATGNVDGAR